MKGLILSLYSACLARLSYEVTSFVLSAQALPTFTTKANVNTHQKGSLKAITYIQLLESNFDERLLYFCNF